MRLRTRPAESACVGLAALVVILFAGSGCGAEGSGTLAKTDCWEILVGSFSASAGSGSVSATGLTVKVKGPNDAAGNPCPKLTSLQCVVYRDVNGNGKKDPGEPGNDLTVGGPSGPPSNEITIGTFSASVGTGIGGPVIVNINVGSSGGGNVTGYNSTSYM